MLPCGWPAPAGHVDREGGHLELERGWEGAETVVTGTSDTPAALLRVGRGAVSLPPTEEQGADLEDALTAGRRRSPSQQHGISLCDTRAPEALTHLANFRPNIFPV